MFPGASCTQLFYGSLIGLMKSASGFSQAECNVCVASRIMYPLQWVVNKTK